MFQARRPFWEKKKKTKTRRSKDKLGILTRILKTVKDKLRPTGFGKVGAADESEHTSADSVDENERSNWKELIPQTFRGMDEILGRTESVNPQDAL